MYIPEYAKSKSDNQIADLVKAYPFVNLISVTSDGQPFITHVPVVTEVVNNKITSIRGHLALRNPHVKYLKESSDVTVVYNGPHTYISPVWYKSGRDVPTWNYCVIHASGKLKFEHSFHAICKNLAELTKEFEIQGPDGWRFDLPADLKEPALLESAIVAFEIQPSKIEAKFKLAQSRPAIDQQGVIEGLASRTDDMSAEIANLMKKNLSEKV